MRPGKTVFVEDTMHESTDKANSLCCEYFRVGQVGSFKLTSQSPVMYQIHRSEPYLESSRNLTLSLHQDSWFVQNDTDFILFSPHREFVFCDDLIILETPCPPISGWSNDDEGSCVVDYAETNSTSTLTIFDF